MPTFPNTLTKDGYAYLIRSPKDLCDLSEYVNAGNDCAGVTFKLAADIDLSDVRFKPIGDGNHHGQGTFFNGTFDGDGHTISNLTINTSEDYQGLFGYTGRGGTVKNVKLENVDINGGDNIGGITGRNDGTISDCLFSGKVASAKWTAGGIAGYNFGTIERCKSIFYGQARRDNVGGIAGASSKAPSRIINCYAVVKHISSVKRHQTNGGIVGWNPRPSSAHGWYYSDDKSLRGVGDGQGYNNTERLYKISLLKASGVNANPIPSVVSGEELYYKDGSTLTLDGALAAGDEIEIRGFSSVPALNGNTVTIGNLTITLNLSLPADEFFWSDVTANAATYKKISYSLKVSGNKIICAADESDLFTLSDINSTNGITIGGNVVTVPKNIRVGKVTVSGDDYKLAEDTPAEETAPVEDTPAEEITLKLDGKEFAIEDGTYLIAASFTGTIKVTAQDIKIFGDNFTATLKKT